MAAGTVGEAARPDRRVGCQADLAAAELGSKLGTRNRAAAATARQPSMPSGALGCSDSDH